MVAPSYSSASTPAVAAMNWREMASLLENDPLLASARMHEKLADPFVRSTETAEVKTNTEEAIDPATTPIEPPKPTPEQLGLHVASTITGGRHAVATINGRSCRVGDVIVVPGGGADFEFTVIDIGAGEVTLEGNGQKQVLKTRRRDSTMKLSQTATGDSEKPQTSGQRVVIGVQLGE